MPQDRTGQDRAGNFYGCLLYTRLFASVAFQSGVGGPSSSPEPRLLRSMFIFDTGMAVLYVQIKMNE